MKGARAPLFQRWRWIVSAMEVDCISDGSGLYQRWKWIVSAMEMDDSFSGSWQHLVSMRLEYRMRVYLLIVV